ncbi:hypothetical protein KIN20_035431 [Parelaphostrongylus tenuis]|uniref:Uncharacterized protein n=1 Tax=Parelaphostrongylus tenuis TaxID=148309 RepID=A0AAD5WJP6_PARTN|nr:hypothetical protein KIN20_035431 [Parelaphostrongylus tenuis]
MPTATSDHLVHDRPPLYAIGKTQAYLLSLVASSRPIVMLKSYDQLVDEKLLPNDIYGSSIRFRSHVRSTTSAISHSNDYS